MFFVIGVRKAVGVPLILDSLLCRSAFGLCALPLPIFEKQGGTIHRTVLRISAPIVKENMLTITSKWQFRISSEKQILTLYLVHVYRVVPQNSCSVSILLFSSFQDEGSSTF